MSDREQQSQKLLINNNLKEIINDIVLSIELTNQKKEQIKNLLSFLTDIEHIYKFQNDQLYTQTTLKFKDYNNIYKFEAELLMNLLARKFFSQIHMFKEAYEIEVLKSKIAKYGYLSIEEPLITVSIPRPFISQPLSEAKYIGEAQCLSFEQQTGIQKTIQVVQAQ